MRYQWSYVFLDLTHWYVHSLSFLNIDMAHVVEIHHRERHGSVCLVHPCVRDKRRVSEIDLSQPRHETAFWWRHNRPVTSQSTDPFTLPNYPLESIGIYVHINTQNKESRTQRCRKSTNVQLTVFDIFVHIHMVWVLLYGMRYLASQITVTASPLRRMQLSVTSLFG